LINLSFWIENSAKFHSVNPKLNLTRPELQLIDFGKE